MDKNYVVGVDVGGQTSKIGVVDIHGTVLEQTVIRTDNDEDPQAFVDTLAAAIKDLIKKSGKEGQIRGIGVGAPNGNYYTGGLWSSKGNERFHHDHPRNWRGQRYRHRR